MPDDRPEISPYALSTEQRATAYIGRDRAAESQVQEWVAFFLNVADGKFERFTGRRLACRTYRTPVTITCTTSVGLTTITAASGFLALKTLDDVVGVNLRTGTRVESIQSDGALTLSKPATASGATGLTFGSAPLEASGYGEVGFGLSQFPGVELYGASYLNSDGGSTPLVLTGHRLVKKTGRVYLTQDLAPLGDNNLRIECKAGYRPPSPTELGDPEWAELELLTLRYGQVLFQDFMKGVGRAGDISVLQATQHIQSFRLPQDIAEGLGPFRRLWG